MNEEVKVKSRINNVIITVLLVAVLISFSWLGLRMFVFERYQVNGISMSPTISDGDWVWANKLTSAERYSVVSIKAQTYMERASSQSVENGGKPINDRPEILLKRVIGVEGDILSTEGRYVKIERPDGTVILLDNEDYGGGKLAKLSYWINGGYNFNLKTEIIPAGFVFVLGDMRGSSGTSVSVDSRMFGIVAVEDIIAVIYGYRQAA